MNRIKRNTLANYLGQAYALVAGLAVIPGYLVLLGSESYGLVGFFAVMQVWLQIFDLGMTPALARQVAIARVNNSLFEQVRKLLRSFELIVLLISIGVITLTLLFKDSLALNWFDTDQLEQQTVATCLLIMAVNACLRWAAAFYRGGIIGYEKQVWANAINALMVTARYPGALLFLFASDAGIVEFFIYQALVSLTDLIVLARKLYALFPAARPLPFKWDGGALRDIAPFSGAIAYTAALSVLVTQVDKLVLSGFLPLQEFGYYAAMIVLASGINQLGYPIYQATLPRMTSLLADSGRDQMVNLYSKATQVVTVMVLPIASLLAIYPNQVLFLWTGDKVLANNAGPMLTWYALGSAVMAINAFQYYLQVATGQLRMHVVGSTIVCVVQLPFIFYAAKYYGGLGASIVWFAFRLLYLIVWTPLIHRRFLPGLHTRWLLRDVLPSVLITSVVAILFFILVDLHRVDSRIGMLLYFSAFLIVSLLAAIVSSSFLRDYARYLYSRRLPKLS